MKRVNLGTVWCANQPPTQADEVVKRIDNESYNPIFSWLSQHSGLKVSIAINRSLDELLIKNKRTNSLDKLGVAVQFGSVELMGGLAYHPLAPLLVTSKYGKDEIKRQNELNYSFNKRIFGGLWKPRGFYLPEFGYSDDVGKLVKEMGYDYTVTNGLLYAEKNRKPQPFNRIVQANDLNIFFTSDWSREFAMNRPDKGDFDTKRLICDMLNGMSSWFNGKAGYTLMGYDIETIGHHQKGYGTHTLELMLQAIRENDMESVLLNELLEMFPERESAEIFPGTQSTSAEDIRNNEFFPLWKHSKNRIHEKIFSLEDYAINVINETAKINGNSNIYKIAREDVDKGLYSCKSWQANPLAGHFIPWLITRGVDKLVNGIAGCCFILKDYNSRININGKLADADEIIENTKEIEHSIHKLILKEEINRCID